MTIWWFLIASWSSFITTAGGVDPGLDLLEALELHNSSHQGVTSTPGPQRLKLAFYLQGDYRDLKLPLSVYQRAVDLLRHNAEFTLAASLRQEEANTGTIVSFSHGYNRYLEVESSGRKDEIRLHYISQHDSLVHVETFPYRLADNSWHKVAVSVSGAQVELLVDCHILYRRLIRPPDRNFTLPQLTLWIGQRNNKHSLFKGTLQDVRLIPGAHGYLSQCPHQNSTCPTCGQFSLLQNTVEQLTRNLQELSERLVSAEGRLRRVEDCDCERACRVNGTVHPDGTRWEKNCNICSCVHGSVECHRMPCPKIICKNPVFNADDCCPSCLKQCLLHGVMYDHGESYSPKQCLECSCRDGSMTCNKIDPETACPPLTCPLHQQFSVPGECCQFCRAVCNHTCLNGGECVAPGHCLCRKGYIGPSCELDLDECAADRHRCHETSQCVNMPGWYYCKCKAGYRSTMHGATLVTRCQDIDECSEGGHSCHSSARCINNEGGFRCYCDQENAPQCKLSCIFEGNEVANGLIVSPRGQPCKRCECQEGVMTCREPTCDCSLRGSRSDKCCPQCDPNSACRHQELKHVVFRSTDRWIYQCQTCECLFGEIDCWQMECPPVTCSDPVQAPGDCCKRCEDDPCSLDGGLTPANTSALRDGQPCIYAGRFHDSGTEWHDTDDKCTACNCKDGFLRCSYDRRCSSSNDRPYGAQPNHPANLRHVDTHTTPVTKDGSKVPDHHFFINVPSQAQVPEVNGPLHSQQTKEKKHLLPFVDENETSFNNKSETLALRDSTTKATWSDGNDSTIVYVSGSEVGYANSSEKSGEASSQRDQEESREG